MNNKKDVEMKNIPLKGSLGVLAYGDLAFTQWRKLKVEHNIFERENGEVKKYGKK